MVWWWRFDLKPLPMRGSPAWHEQIARRIQIAFYVVILCMVASGIGMRSKRSFTLSN
jgi:cytochrome b561